MPIRRAPRSAPSRPTFGGVTPILRVSSLGTSIDYYTRVLGFTVDFVDVIASVARDRYHLFLVEGDQGHVGGWIWIGVSDVDALYEEYRTSGARIRQPPTNFSWACEMQVTDPDGNVLRVGSAPKADRPHGPWLDMQGRLWHRRADGWVLEPSAGGG